MATLALISFTHSDPLCRAISGIDTVRATPSAILDGVIEGRYDYGMVSLLGYIRNMDRLSLIDSGTIHSNGKILSTILVSTQLSIKKGSQVSVTAHSETTLFYAKAISERLGLDLEFIPSRFTEARDLLSERDYALVIGDEALKVYQSRYRILMDIGFEFSLLFHLPPVFAVTVAGKDSVSPPINGIIDDAVRNSSLYREESVKVNSGKLGVKDHILAEYYSLLRYGFDDSVRKSIEFVESIYSSGRRDQV